MQNKISYFNYVSQTENLYSTRLCLSLFYKNMPTCFKKFKPRSTNVTCKLITSEQAVEHTLSFSVRVRWLDFKLKYLCRWHDNKGQNVPNKKKLYYILWCVTNSAVNLMYLHDFFTASYNKIKLTKIYFVLFIIQLQNLISHIDAYLKN